jgi:hypothetical protein
MSSVPRSVYPQETPRRLAEPYLNLPGTTIANEFDGNFEIAIMSHAVSRSILYAGPLCTELIVLNVAKLFSLNCRLFRT